MLLGVYDCKKSSRDSPGDGAWILESVGDSGLVLLLPSHTHLASCFLASLRAAACLTTNASSLRFHSDRASSRAALFSVSRRRTTV